MYILFQVCVKKETFAFKKFEIIKKEMVGSDNMEDLINVMAKRRIAVKRLEVKFVYLLLKSNCSLYCFILV